MKTVCATKRESSNNHRGTVPLCYGVKAKPTAKATMQKRAGQKRYSKSTLRNANKRLKKEKEHFSDKISSMTNTFLNGFSGLIKRLAKNEEEKK